MARMSSTCAVIRAVCCHTKEEGEPPLFADGNLRKVGAFGLMGALRCRPLSQGHPQRSFGTSLLDDDEIIRPLQMLHAKCSTAIQLFILSHDRRFASEQRLKLLHQIEFS